MTYQEAKAYFKGFADKQTLLCALSGNLTIQQRKIIQAVDIDGSHTEKKQEFDPMWKIAHEEAIDEYNEVKALLISYKSA